MFIPRPLVLPNFIPYVRVLVALKILALRTFRWPPGVKHLPFLNQLPVLMILRSRQRTRDDLRIRIPDSMTDEQRTPNPKNRYHLYDN
jgi:hypothetical protein